MEFVPIEASQKVKAQVRRAVGVGARVFICAVPNHVGGAGSAAGVRRKLRGGFLGTGGRCIEWGSGWGVGGMGGYGICLQLY